LELGRQLGNQGYVSMVLVALGHALTMTGDLQLARAHLEEALAIRRPLGHLLGISSALDSLGRVAFHMGNYPEAEALFKEGLEIGRQAGDICSMAFCLHGLGQVAQGQRDFEHSRSYLMQSIMLRQEYKDRRGIVDSLISLVDVLTMQGDHEQATRLAGMAEVVCEAIGADLHLIDRVEHERSLDILRNRLGPEQFSRLWAEGKHLSVEQVLEQENTASLDRDAVRPETTPRANGYDDPAGLTPRELDVLRAIATGMTNAQAADTLSISPHTVNMHVRSIFAKLGVTSRSAATRYAIVNRLI
jgi:DNA-binding CsgD family transcriptional regulator/tetratricopeptide (TPR) repeat protein